MGLEQLPPKLQKSADGVQVCERRRLIYPNDSRGVLLLLRNGRDPEAKKENRVSLVIIETNEVRHWLIWKFTKSPDENLIDDQLELVRV
jgi:hypothetical protein